MKSEPENAMSPPSKDISFPGRPGNRKSCVLIDIPLLDYEIARELQQRLVAGRHAGWIENDVFLMLEHPPVFTLGKNGRQENLVVRDTFLKEQGLRLIPVERGGDITYHGPGQIIVYPVMDLNKAGLGVRTFVTALESVMIRTASDWDIVSTRNSRNRGVWVDGKKLGSVGIAVRRGIAFHGLALNVNVPLEPFTWINPCGLIGVAITTMEKEYGEKISTASVRESVKRQIASVFGVRFAEPDDTVSLCKKGRKTPIDV